MEHQIKSIHASNIPTILEQKIESLGGSVGCITGTSAQAKNIRSMLPQGLSARTVYDICRNGDFLKGTQFRTVKTIYRWLGYQAIIIDD